MHTTYNNIKYFRHRNFESCWIQGDLGMILDKKLGIRLQCTVTAREVTLGPLRAMFHSRNNGDNILFRNDSYMDSQCDGYKKA